MMQERAPSRARKPTARRSADRSGQRERTWVRLSSPGLIVTTRKIATFVSGEETSCGRLKAADARVVRESEAIRDRSYGNEVPLKQTLEESFYYVGREIPNFFILYTTAADRLVAVGASAVVTIFDVGRRRALNDQAKGAYESTVAFYRETALTAFQQVEDHLAALRVLEQEADVQANAVKSHSGR